MKKKRILDPNVEYWRWWSYNCSEVIANNESLLKEGLTLKPAEVTTWGT